MKNLKVIDNPVVVIVNNYDPFTYNLAHLVKELGTKVDVLHNNQFKIEELGQYDKITLSPDPGMPEEAEPSSDVIRTYSGKKPMLDVCPGEQTIEQVFGGRSVDLNKMFRGVQADIQLTEPDYTFRGLPAGISVGRYHSWVADMENLPRMLVIIVVSPKGQTMALKHREYDTRGIQFHPESVLTPDRKQIMASWLQGDENITSHRDKWHIL